MKKFIILLIIFSSLFFGQKVVSAKDIHVTEEMDLQKVLNEAKDGDIITIEEGIYEGNFTITNSLTVSGKSGTVIKGPNKGNVLTIDANHVVIENLQIEGSGTQNAGIYVKGNQNKMKNNKLYNVFNGIQVKDGYANEITENLITGFKNNGAHQGFGVYLIEAPHTKVKNNYLYDTNDGIYISFSDLCEISYNEINKSRYGIHTMDSKNIVITQNHITESRNGLMIMQSDYINIKENVLEHNTTIDGAGMFIYDTFDSKISANIMKQNNKGIYLENALRNQIVFNEFVENDTGIELSEASDDNQVILNNFTGNNQQIITDKENENNTFHLEGYGNYWDDFHPLDTNQDEVNDYAYKSGDVFYNLTSSEPYLQIFSGSPAVRLWNTIEQFVPIPSDQFIVDEYPLMEKTNVELATVKPTAEKNQTSILWKPLFFFGISFIIGVMIMVKSRRKQYA